MDNKPLSWRQDNGLLVMIAFLTLGFSLALIIGSARSILRDLARPISHYPACEDDVLFDRMLERAVFVPARRQSLRRPARAVTPRRLPSFGAAA
jgi:hypothetical protein